MVIGATVNFLLTGPSQAPWSVGHCKLGSIVLQFGVEGGSKILHGISPPDALSFVFQDEKIADRMIFDGQILQPQDFVVLPAGSDFTFASCGIHRWMSISMPVGLFETLAIETGRKHFAWVEKEKCVISPPEQLLKCLTAAAASTAVLIREKQTSALHGFSIARLLNALITATAGLDNEMCLPTEKSRLSSDTVTKALKYAGGQKWEGLQVAGGAAVTNNNLLQATTFGGVGLNYATSTRWGGAIGVGFEYGFTPNGSAAIEYDRLIMGDANNSFSVPAGAAAAVNRISQDVDLVTVRVNYKFGGPVVAAY